MEKQISSSPQKVNIGDMDMNINLGQINHDATHKNYLQSLHTKVNLPIIYDKEDMTYNSESNSYNNKLLQLINKTAVIDANQK